VVPLLVIHVLLTTPVALLKSVLQTALLLLLDTPLSMVLLQLAQIQHYHAQEVSYQPKFYSPQVPQSLEQLFQDVLITMLQVHVFSVLLSKQVSKTAQLAHQTVSTAPCHQEQHLVQFVTVDTIHGQMVHV